MTHEERALCATTAHFVRTHRVLAAFGLLCTALSMVAILQLASSTPINRWSLGGLVACVVLGMVERYLALRLHFDAGLFDELASNPQFDLQQLDRTLQDLGFHRSVGENRDLILRIDGTRHLYRRHVICVALQFSVLFLSGCLR